MSKETGEEKKYWFPAKTYGWGWGVPSAWQGWAVVVLYLVLIALSIVIFLPDKQWVLFLLSDISLTILLIVICWIKGEPPKWRWGK
jgi:hypothetical protein